MREIAPRGSCGFKGVLCSGVSMVSFEMKGNGFRGFRGVQWVKGNDWIVGLEESYSFVTFGPGRDERRLLRLV